MQNISNTLPTTSNTLPVTNNSGNASLLSKCKTCDTTGDNQVLSYHKYNCPKRKISCNNCLKNFTIQQFPEHATICEEVEVKYTFGSKKEVLIKKSILSSIKLAEEVLNNNSYIHDDEKIKIYKQAVISYNKLTAKFNSISLKYFSWRYEIISYDEYKKIIDENIRLETNKPLNDKSKDEITKNYLQSKIKYKIDNLPEVEITVAELLHIKEVEARLANITSIATPNQDELSFYQQAVTIYKELIANLESGKHRENRKFNDWLSIRSKLKNTPSLRGNYCIDKRLKIEIPEKPLITQGFPLNLADDAGMISDNISGTIFSFLSIDKVKDTTVKTFEPSCKNFPSSRLYNIDVKINSTPNYHTAEDTGIYLLLTYLPMGYRFRTGPAGGEYILAVSYIDKDDYKNLLFHISFTAKELFENLHCTDVQDQTTKFGYLNRSDKMKQLNRFFNDDGIGTEYINKYGCDSIFGLEFYKLTPGG